MMTVDKGTEKAKSKGRIENQKKIHEKKPHFSASQRRNTLTMVVRRNGSPKKNIFQFNFNNVSFRCPYAIVPDSLLQGGTK